MLIKVVDCTKCGTVLNSRCGVDDFHAALEKTFLLCQCLFVSLFLQNSVILLGILPLHPSLPKSPLAVFLTINIMIFFNWLDSITGLDRPLGAAGTLVPICSSVYILIFTSKYTALYF